MSKDEGRPSRESAWLQAWLVVARAEGAHKPVVATSWADACLAAFDARFPQKKES